MCALRVFEAFAGYGSTCFALKALRVDHELVGFSEIDKYAIECFQQNHGGKNFGDITKINWGEVPDFDLLTGGFPCQAFSTAGKQKGEADKRGVLGLELTKALIAKQPKYFLFENVKGFMSKRFTETREKFVKSWENAGYKVVYKVLNTKDFGIPQNRERVWFVGIRKDINQEFNFPEPFELKLRLKDILENEVNEKYFLRREQVDKLFDRIGREKLKGNNFREQDLPQGEIVNTLKSSDYKEPKCIELKEMTKGVSDAMRVYSDDGISKTLKGLGGGMGAKTGLYAVGCAVRAFPRTGSNDENRVQQLELGKTDIANSITNVQKDSMIFKTQFGKHQQDCFYDSDGIMANIPAGTHGSTPHLTKTLVNEQVRRLTPKECFRLQGFLEDEINLEGLSDTQKYKLAGNGQSINVVQLILKNLLGDKNSFVSL